MINLQKWSQSSIAIVFSITIIGILASTSISLAQSSATSSSAATEVSAEALQNKISSTSLDEFSKSTQNYTIELVSSPSERVVGDFVVGPGKTDITISPGTSKVVELIVTNRTGELREFNFEVEDATGSNNPTTPIVLLGSERGPYTLKDYIQLPRASIDLEHNERARIPVTISVPPDAEPGGRYGSVLVTTVSKDAVKGEEGATAPASAIISRVGSLFFLTIPGETEVAGEFKSIALVPDTFFLTKGPVNMQLLFENNGDLHLNPYGEIRITNITNAEVGFIELDPWFAMPQSIRSREISWEREFLIGRYTATAYINRGYDNIVDAQSVTFWVLPWKVVAAIFGGLFVFFLAIRFIVKNFEFKRKNN